MLVLTLTADNPIVIAGCLKIHLLTSKGGSVQLAFDGPLPVDRQSLWDRYDDATKQQRTCRVAARPLSPLGQDHATESASHLPQPAAR